MLAATHTAANAMTRQPPDPAAALASGRRRTGAGTPHSHKTGQA